MEKIQFTDKMALALSRAYARDKGLDPDTVRFRAYVGDGWIPDRSEFDLAVRTISRDADIEIMNDPSFMSWSEPERTYMAIREQAYRIARYFEWTLEGGRIE